MLVAVEVNAMLLSFTTDDLCLGQQVVAVVDVGWTTGDGEVIGEKSTW